MKLPTTAGLIKNVVVAWSFAAGAVGVGALSIGCGPAVATAGFRARPGSVLYGDLRGPFDGQVIDASTRKPIAGATVLASWAWRRGVGFSAPAGAVWRRAQTDADGRYQVPRLDEERAGVLERFTLVVYKHGYVGYRSDRRWDDLGERADFVASGARVALDPFPPSESHARHLRYLGAGGPLLAELGWELQLASDELEGARAEEAPSAPSASDQVIDAAQLLSPDELKAVTGYAGEFTIEKLGDLPTTATYDSLHYKAVDKPETFDAALRVFKAEPTEAERQYEKVLSEYPSVEEKNEVGDRSLRAREDELLAVVALDRKRGDVVVFTCGKDQCHDQDTMVAILKRVWPRLDRIVVPRRPGGDATPRPDKPGPLKLRRPELK